MTQANACVVQVYYWSVHIYLLKDSCWQIPAHRKVLPISLPTHASGTTGAELLRIEKTEFTGNISERKQIAVLAASSIV